jgi:hypothetical protein
MPQIFQTDIRYLKLIGPTKSSLSLDFIHFRRTLILSPSSSDILPPEMPPRFKSMKRADAASNVTPPPEAGDIEVGGSPPSPPLEPPVVSASSVDPSKAPVLKPFVTPLNSSLSPNLTMLNPRLRQKVFLHRYLRRVQFRHLQHVSRNLRS